MVADRQWVGVALPDVGKEQGGGWGLWGLAKRDLATGGSGDSGSGE